MAETCWKERNDKFSPRTFTRLKTVDEGEAPPPTSVDTPFLTGVRIAAGIVDVAKGAFRGIPCERGKATPIVGTIKQERWTRTVTLICLSVLRRSNGRVATVMR